MIKVNELRLGNLITYLDEIYVVNGITHEELNPKQWRIAFKTINGKMGNAKTYDWIEPVPLTLEWLERCGFVDNIPWEKGNLRLDGDNRLHVVDSTGYGIIIARNIQYLHQLQNLFFALTGEELNVKP